MDNPTHLPHGRLVFLDVVRAISVILIILYHFDGQLQTQAPSSHIVGKIIFYGQAIGDIGVSLFIMISGAALMVSSREPFRWIEFFKKRILAILPSYWIAYLATSIILFLIRHGITGNGPHWTFILTILGMDGFLGYRIPNYYLVGEWFVGFILITYLFFPALRFSILRHPVLTIIGTISVAVVIHQYHTSLFFIPEARNPLIRLPEFLFGIVFVQFLMKKRKLILISSTTLLVLFLIWLPTIIRPIYPIIIDITIFSFFGSIVQLIPMRFIPFHIINFLSKFAFLAFLVHHQIIYNLLPLFNVGRLSIIEVNYLFLIVLMLSFVAAVGLGKLVDILTIHIKNLWAPSNSSAHLSKNLD